MLGCCCSCHPGFSWKSCQFWITCLFWVNATCTLQVLSGKWLSLTWLHNLIPTYLSKHRFYCNPSRLIVCDFLDVSIFLYFLVMLFLLWKCLCSFHSSSLQSLRDSSSFTLFWYYPWITLNLIQHYNLIFICTIQNVLRMESF